MCSCFPGYAIMADGVSCEGRYCICAGLGQWSQKVWGQKVQVNVGTGPTAVTGTPENDLNHGH